MLQSIAKIYKLSIECIHIVLMKEYYNTQFFPSVYKYAKNNGRKRRKIGLPTSLTQRCLPVTDCCQRKNDRKH